VDVATVFSCVHGCVNAQVLQSLCAMPGELAHCDAMWSNTSSNSPALLAWVWNTGLPCNAQQSFWATLLTCLYVCRMPTSFKCQLCDKKFKGAEYLTKHMHNKHQTDIENFRIEEREKVCLMGQSQGQLCSGCPFHFLCAQVRQDRVD
jgi:hypothetical protein